jgi:hypothetical protein
MGERQRQRRWAGWGGPRRAEQGHAPPDSERERAPAERVGERVLQRLAQPRLAEARKVTRPQSHSPAPLRHESHLAEGS